MTARERTFRDRQRAGDSGLKSVAVLNLLSRFGLACGIWFPVEFLHGGYRILLEFSYLPPYSGAKRSRDLAQDAGNESANARAWQSAAMIQDYAVVPRSLRAIR